MSEIIEFIKKSPKAELHLHIEGTLEPDLLFRLAKKNNIKIPFSSTEEIKSAYNFKNLESFLKIFYQGSSVLITEQDFYDLTWAYVLKCKENNIFINGIYKALQKGSKEFGLTFGIIMCFLRHLDEMSAFKMLDKANEHKDKIIGVGLDSSEIGHPPKKFERVFKKAIEYGFLTVAHAGEEGPPEYIW